MVPRFGSTPLNSIEPDEVEAWVDSLSAKGLAPATVRKNYQLLNQMLASAVRSRHIAWNPAARVEHLPKATKYEPRFITPTEIGSIADVIHPRYRTLVLVGGFCGLRFGEAVALEIEDLDLLHRSLLISSTLIEVNGTISKADTKTISSRRKVALPRFLVEELATHVSEWSNGDGRVFNAPDGGPLIAQGEHVKVIADRLGHANPMVTLTTYAHLFDGLDRDAADRLDDAWARSVTEPRRTQTQLSRISTPNIAVENSR